MNRRTTRQIDTNETGRRFPAPAEIGRKVAQSAGLAAIHLPSQGVSAIDRQGAAFDDPEARRALFHAIRQNCGNIPVIELDCHMNDAAFAESAARQLLELIRQSARA